MHKSGSYSAVLKEKVSHESLKGGKMLQQIASETSSWYSSGRNKHWREYRKHSTKSLVDTQLKA